MASVPVPVFGAVPSAPARAASSGASSAPSASITGLPVYTVSGSSAPDQSYLNSIASLHAPDNGSSSLSPTTTNSSYVAPTAAQTAPLLASLNSLGDILTNKNNQSQAEHDAAINGYNAQDQLDQQAIQQNTNQNEQNLTANDQAAVLNAVNGATGLRGVLASLGALGGSGLDVIRNLVGKAANSDAGDARQTFNTNANTISQSAAQTSQEEKQRRADADATLANALQDNQADVLNSKQGIYQQLASLYGANTAQGNTYASQAGALAPQIAATTRATVAPYEAASSLYSPATLATYLAGTQNLNAATTGNSTTPINSAAYTTTKKDDTLQGVA